MKILLVNGSPHQHGSTDRSLREIGKVLEADGVEYEIFWLGNGLCRDCIGCGGCRKTQGRCVFDDDPIANQLIEKARGSDGFVFGSPVYYAHPSARILAELDRAFYAGGSAFCRKPAAVLAVARRAGTTATLDVLTKHLTISEMPVVSSTYWMMTHGAVAEDVEEDAEGLQTARNLAKNLIWLCRSIEEGKAANLPHPPAEHGARTNFIH